MGPVSIVAIVLLACAVLVVVGAEWGSSGASGRADRTPLEGPSEAEAHPRASGSGRCRRLRRRASSANLANLPVIEEPIVRRAARGARAGEACLAPAAAVTYGTVTVVRRTRVFGSAGPVFSVFFVSW
jgi:hypothetical protein